MCVCVHVYICPEWETATSAQEFAAVCDREPTFLAEEQHDEVWTDMDQEGDICRDSTVIKAIVRKGKGVAKPDYGCEVQIEYRGLRIRTADDVAEVAGARASADDGPAVIGDDVDFEELLTDVAFWGEASDPTSSTGSDNVGGTGMVFAQGGTDTTKSDCTKMSLCSSVS